MLAAERRERIMEILLAEQRVKVRKLSETLHISDVTIRKDLSLLEKAGRLERSFGGAVLPSNPMRYAKSSYVTPEILTDYEEKQTIGRLAAGLVEDEDFIFLGPGLTCLEVAKNVKSKQRLSIMTTNISAAIELAGTPEFKVISAPGDFTKRNGTYYVTGPLLYDFFQNTFFDKVLLTMDGFSLQRGFSVLDETTSKIYQSLLRQAKSVIICATTSKFEKNAMAYLGPANLADTIVTGAAPSGEYASYFKERGIRVIHP